MRDQIIREHLVELLGGGGAHLGFDQAIKGLPTKFRGKRPDHASHTPWRLVEHMRIAQWDIVEFCRNPKHVSPNWPEGYWPRGDAPPDDQAWDRSLAQFREDLGAMKRLVLDPSVDLLARLPHGTGQTVLREAMLVADHNAYHLGQLVIVRRALGAWQDV